jgi:very-short-patch-repair endonuclease
VFTEDVHILAERAIALEGVACHRTELWSERDIVERAGCRVLRPARLVCDLAAHLDEGALESVIEQVLDRELATMPMLRRHAERFIAPGRPGSVRLARVLESRPGWLRPVDSDLELRVWRALRDRGLPLDRQVRVELDGGEYVAIDLADRALRFGVEVDHVTWHGGRLDAQRDKRRDRGLARLGWSISRVTDEDLTLRFAETIDQLVAIVAQLARRAS